jgi:hypothetical protein
VNYLDYDDILVLAILWLGHAVITLPVVAPVVWFTRRFVRWHWWELTVFLVPFAVWLTLIISGALPKTLANLGEAVYVSAAIVVAAILRAALARIAGSRMVPALLIASVTACAVGVYYFTPMWPEV